MELRKLSLINPLTFRELLARKGAFSEFIIQYIQDFDQEELAEIQDQIEDEDLKFIIQKQTSVISQSPDKISKEGSVRRRSSRRSQEEDVEKPKPVTKLIETEDSATGSVEWAVYLRYFKSIGLPYFITILVFNGINQSMAVLSNCKD